MITAASIQEQMNSLFPERVGLTQLRRGDFLRYCTGRNLIESIVNAQKKRN